MSGSTKVEATYKQSLGKLYLSGTLEFHNSAISVAGKACRGAGAGISHLQSRRLLASLT